ncbi:MAG: DNA polymerase III subunit gamma/tau [Rikenellaceae bacterium]
MSDFIVSARKYRPLTFSSVVGQQHITSTFINAIERNKLAHAYIFCGPRGVGKTTCARIIAKSINCLHPTADHEACNECESCVSFNKNASFNIHELDAASNNSVEDIRELSRQVLTPPQIGKYSIYIIDEVHMLSSAAFNAFLKTLEEPPSYAIFILATTEKHKILPTILSRCQIYDFKRIMVGDVVGYLEMISSKEGVSYDEQSLTLIAQKADGCMRDALSMYDKVVSYCDSKLSFKEVAEALNVLDYNTYFTFTNTLFEGDYQNALMIFDEALQKGFDAGKILDGLNKHFRDILVARDEKTLPLLELPSGVAQQFMDNGKNIDPSYIFNAMSLIAECEEKMRNALNQRLLCELTLLKICNINGACFIPQKKNEHPLPIIITSQESSTNTPRQEPKKEVLPEPDSVSAVPTQATTPTPITKAETPIPEVKKEVPTNEPTTLQAKKSLFGIPSINNISKQAKEEKKIEEATSNIGNKDIPVDQGILLDACHRYAESIKEKHQRISIVFSEAQVEGALIKVKVENEILADDINKNKSDILRGIVAIGEIEGVIDFEITICEPDKKNILVFTKDSDRFMHLNAINPKLEGLTKRLDLEFNYR